MIYISNSFSWEVHSPSHCGRNEERTTPDFVGVVEPSTFALYDDPHLLYITALGATEPSIFLFMMMHKYMQSAGPCTRKLSGTSCFAPAVRFGVWSTGIKPTSSQGPRQRICSASHAHCRVPGPGHLLALPDTACTLILWLGEAAGSR